MLRFLSLLLCLFSFSCQTSCWQRGEIKHEQEIIQDMARQYDRSVRVDVGAAYLSQAEDGLEIKKMFWQGSGVVLESRDVGSLILTVDHVCRPKPQITVNEKIYQLTVAALEVSKYDSKEVFPGKPVYSDATNDLCLVVVPNFQSSKVFLATQMPPRWAKVIYTGGPYGMIGHGLSFVGEGRYYGMGLAKNNLNYGYISAPSTFGASGAGVFYQGKLIGLVTMAGLHFEHATLIVPIERIKDFIARATIQ